MITLNDNIDVTPVPPYYNEESFNNYFTNKNSLSIFHLNIRSLNKNGSNLLTFLSSIKLEFDIIIISEIWSNNIDISLNQFTGYQKYYTLPQRSNIGGICILIKSNLSHKEINIKSYDDIENIAIEITINKTKILIIGTYRHPNNNTNNMTNFLKEIKHQKNIILLGDININLLDNRNGPVRKYTNNLLELEFLPKINHPTRITKNSKTLLDHIYSKGNKINKLNIDTGIIITDISDHMGTFMIINNTPNKNNKERIRIYSKNNINKFIETLSTKINTLVIENDVHTSTKLFIDVLKTSHDSAFPLKKKSRKCQKHKPWITKSLIRCSKHKNTLYRKWIKTKNPSDESRYLRYKKIFTKCLVETENNYFREKIQREKNNSKKMWKNINSLMKSNKKAEQIEKIYTNNKTITNEKEIANEMNTYFSNIGKVLDEKINNNYNFLDYLSDPYHNSIYLEDTNEEEIIKIINKLPNKNTTGVDNIPTKVLKFASLNISKTISKLINLSLANGEFPNCLKISKLIPIFKAGDKTLIENYRPIALLPTLNKIFEEVMNIRLMKYLENTKQLNCRQFGFRKKHSTSDALIQLTDFHYNNLDNNNISTTVFFDLKKAFDTVNHKILITKLAHYGIRGIVNRWFQSFISNRYQYTQINNYQSPMEKIECGLPQGSKLSPILYLIYVNDIVNVDIGRKNELLLFADDTCLSNTSNNIITLIEQTNENIEKLSKWFKANRLTLNLNKTKYILSHTKKHENEINNSNINLYIDGINIEKVSKYKYLGIIIDNKLTFRDHIDNICKKIKAKIPSIIKIKNKLTTYTKKVLYHAIFHSHLNYGSIIYGTSLASNIMIIKKLQNKIIKIMFGTPINHKAKDLYSKYKILKIDDIIKLNKLVFIHNYIHDQGSPILHKIKYENITNHLQTYNTRNQYDFPIKRSNKQIGTRLSYNFTLLWNNLPRDLKEINLKHTFNKNIKSYLQKNY